MLGQDTLFVYGSFAEGMVHFNKVVDFVTEITPAVVKGSAYRLKVGFPAFVNQGEDAVPGQLLKLKKPEVVWPLLDEFHGFSQLNPEKSLFLRTPIAVKVDGVEEPVETYIYAINPTRLPTTAALIENGDWQESLRESPALTMRLTDRQRNYIQRLGASTGREIVPIDLQLYRELMSMELIVDKGRRLALTPLGQEVHRYLF